MKHCEMLHFYAINVSINCQCCSQILGAKGHIWKRSLLFYTETRNVRHHRERRKV